MKKADKKVSRKKGEEGFWERDTSEAHKASCIFPDAESFTKAANKYFDECDASGELYGEAGLCLGLSKYNEKGRIITTERLRQWWNGDTCDYLQDAVRLACMRIQNQIETDPRYREKGGMATVGIFLRKQKMFGGYQDRNETKTEATVKIIHGSNVEESDFQ